MIAWLHSTRPPHVAPASLPRPSTPTVTQGCTAAASNASREPDPGPQRMTACIPADVQAGAGARAGQSLCRGGTGGQSSASQPSRHLQEALPGLVGAHQLGLTQEAPDALLGVIGVCAHIVPELRSSEQHWAAGFGQRKASVQCSQVCLRQQPDGGTQACSSAALRGVRRSASTTARLLAESSTACWLPTSHVVVR
jgi:hypothetical protein